MITALAALFWVSAGAIVYTYAVYPIVVGLLAWMRKREVVHTTDGAVPVVSVVISVYNEERVLQEKLENLALLEYPAGRIEFLFGSDGSDDRTVALLECSSLAGLRVFAYPARRGKCAVVNDLVREARGAIVVFSDANTIYDRETVVRLVEHFADPAIGGVCGELLLRSDIASAAGKGETSYWKYETVLKKWESAYETIVGATGGVYAIRRDLFRPLPVHKPVVDDFLTPLEVVRRGYRMVYEPRALAFEEASGSIAVEFRRRVRIGAQNLSGMPEVADLLNPFRGFIAFALWSHKLLRWGVPLFGGALFITSALLAAQSPLYAGLFIAGVCGLLLAAAGGIMEWWGIRGGVFGFPFYMVTMNIALFVGFLKCLSGRQQTTWKVERAIWEKAKNA